MGRPALVSLMKYFWQWICTYRWLRMARLAAILRHRAASFSWDGYSSRGSSSRRYSSTAFVNTREWWGECSSSCLGRRCSSHSVRWALCEHLARAQSRAKRSTAAHRTPIGSMSSASVLRTSNSRLWHQQAASRAWALPTRWAWACDRREGGRTCRRVLSWRIRDLKRSSPTRSVVLLLVGFPFGCR